MDFSSLEIYQDKVLGVGSYGKVCKAKFGRLPCAAKLLHDTMFKDGDPGIFKFVEQFQQECHFLSVIKHPNVVQYLGTSYLEIPNFQSRRLVLLMELMDEGLTRFLERSTSPLPYHIQLNICHDVALALSYLHSNAIVHRDLSSNNVLLIGEGNRAKVTDFGMSKLMDINHHLTPLTLCPGATVYMPPEALTTPPRYSSKLDCFSHGVITIQTITRNFPNPGDAHRSVEDTNSPTGYIIMPLPETERRKKDIDLIEPNHPLLQIALCCLHNRDTERFSADEICERLDALKTEGRYTHSVEQSRDNSSHFHGLQGEVQRKDQMLQRERDVHQNALQQKEDIICSLENELILKERFILNEREEHQNELDQKDQLIQAERSSLERQAAHFESERLAYENTLAQKEELLGRHQNELEKKDKLLQEMSAKLETQRKQHAKELEQKDQLHHKEKISLQNELEQKDQLLHEVLSDAQKQIADHKIELEANEEIMEDILGSHEHQQAARNQNLAPNATVVEGGLWASYESYEAPAPRWFVSTQGTAVAHENIAYFSHKSDILSLALPDYRWEKVSVSPYVHFSMAIVNGKLATIGGSVDGSQGTHLKFKEFTSATMT